MIIEPTSRLARTVGAIALAVVALAVGFVVLVYPRLQLTPQLRFVVEFGHVGALTAGAPVIVAGQPIGRVESISLRPDRGARVRVAVRRGAAGWLSSDDAFFIAARGMLGERYLEVGPPTTEVAAPRRLHAGDVVRGIDPPSMDQVLLRTWTNLGIARAFLADVGPAWARLRTAIDDLALAWDAVVAATPDGAQGPAWREAWTRGTALLAQPGWPSGDELGATLALADALVAHVDLRLAQLEPAARAVGRDAARLARGGASIGARGDALREALATAVPQVRAGLLVLRAELATLRRRWAAGQGTLVRLLTDPEFPEDAKQLGRILKREPWRLLGPADDPAARPLRGQP